MYLQQSSNYASTKIRLYNRYFLHDAHIKVQEAISSRQLTGMQSWIERLKTYTINAGYLKLELC